MPDTDTVKICRILGGSIRRLRKDRGWTQAELAHRTDLSLDMIGRIERGNAAPSFRSLARLAHRLDVPVTALFGGSIGKGRSGDRGRKLEAIIGTLSALDMQD